MWDLESGEPALGPLTGHTGSVSAVAAGERSGRPVIVSGCSFDETVRVWDLESGDATLRFEAGNATLREYEPRALSVSSTADRLVIGTATDLLRIDLL